MKKICFLASLLVLCAYSWAQDKLVESKPISIAERGLYQKGDWVVDLDRILNFSSNEYRTNDVKTYDRTRLRLNLGTTYMLSDHWGVGLDVDLGSTKWENGGEEKITDWSVMGSALYTNNISNQLAFFARLGVGYGMEKIEETNPTFEQETNNLFIRGAVGVPIQIGDGPIYASPYIRYTRSMLDVDDEEGTINKFGLGANMQGYMNCGMMPKPNNVGTRYNAGNHYFSYYTKAMFGFGDEEWEGPGGGTVYEQDFSDGHLKFDYRYFFINNVYAGLDFQLQTETYKGSGYKETFTGILVKPRVGVQLPVAAPWNNTFVEAGVGFGTDTYKDKFGGSSFEEKEKVFAYDVSVGYNFAVNNWMFISPRIGYGYTRHKDEASPANEYERQGIMFSAGWYFRVGQ